MRENATSEFADRIGQLLGATRVERLPAGLIAACIQFPAPVYKTTYRLT